MGLAISSFHITQLDYSDEHYDPFTYDVYVHNNRFERKSTLPDLTKDFVKMVNLVFKGKPQDILYDGIHDSKRSTGPNPMNICIQQPEEGLRFANIDAENDFESVNTDLSIYDCRRNALQ